MQRLSFFSSILITCFLLLSGAISLCAYSSHKTLPSAKRLEEAEILREHSNFQKAFEIYKEIAGTYRADMTKEEKMICLDAIYGCVESGMALSDFSSVAKYMVLAEEIRDSENITDGSLEIYYSCMFMVMGCEAGNDKMLAKGYPHALKAFDFYIHNGNQRKMALAFHHLLDYYKTTPTPEMLQQLKKASESFKKHHTDKESAEIFLRYYNAVLDEYVNKDYKRASAQYDTIISLIPSNTKNIRRRATLLIAGAGVHVKAGKTATAIANLNRAIELGDSVNQPEINLEAYQIFHNLYASQGDTLAANQYKRKAELLQDSISSYSIADDIYVLEGIKEEKELHNQIAIARYRNSVLQWGIIFAAAILLTVVVFLFILRCKNAGLTERARILRQLLREQTSAKADEKTDGKTKYIGSNLTDEEKNSIAASIRNVLDSEAVFSPDFSLGLLSEKIGKSSKAVSQVINEIFNTNFSTVVNRIRIYEACRRLDSAEYENWSVEGIAESVGYTQRNTFSTNFKKFTGMGIREYKKLSEDEKENLSACETKE